MFTEPRRGAAAAQPATTAELEPSELLILWAFRRWILGLRCNEGRHWSMVWNEFARRLGARDGREGLTALAAMVRHLQASARRTIRHHQPCCGWVGADETAFVAFLRACQADDRRVARGLAEWLVRADAAGAFLEAGLGLAACLRRSGIILPARVAVRPPAAATPVPLAERRLH